NHLSVAEYSVAMILAMVKQLKLADYKARQRQWRSVQSTFLRGKTLGIIGLGKVGSRIAELMKPFELRIIAYDPYVPAEKARDLGVELTDLATLLKESDIVSLHATETAANKRFIGEAQFRLMKPTAYFVNIARGGLVDEGALAKALKENWIAGAALDVFDPEVPEPDNPLLDKEIALRTLYSPHAAGVNAETQWVLANLQVEDCLSGIKGELPKYVVNKEAIPKWQERIRAGL
ncbi:MAG: NAD(P)-dependent oxidoreductase, partial [Chloroflexota bacterium]|nr:NAD(P)-dependent oxidoreductase [Chloroflexota bacterium]